MRKRGGADMKSHIPFAFYAVQNAFKSISEALEKTENIF